MDPFRSSHPGTVLRWLYLLGEFVVCVWGEFIEPQPSLSLSSLAEGATRLPCRFQVQEGKIVQVTWNKVLPDGSKEIVITAHNSGEQKEFGRYLGRVCFERSDPIADSALMIRNTEVSDTGIYICHITTFPSGNFERQLSLTVWSTPITSLEPVKMVEGQDYSAAATCRSVALPAPRLSWDTELAGQPQNHSYEGGSVSTQFSLFPLRSMNGKRLDCLVWHPSQAKPRRLQNRLVVLYPPDPTIKGYDGNWFLGLKGASLKCESGGNPKPQNFTWSRSDGLFPNDVLVQNDTLVFRRALTAADAGIYRCVAKNSVGDGKAELQIHVAESSRQETSFSSLLMIIVGVAAGVLVVVMVIIVVMINRYHKSKNRKLEMELSERKEEISTLTRQASFRRAGSASTDHRMQMEERTSLRVEATLRTSLSSLGDQPRSRDSHSTLSVGRGVGGPVDFPGRPALHSGSRRGERGREREMEGEGTESRQRVESFLINSSLALDRPLHAPLHPSVPMGTRSSLPPYSSPHAELPAGGEVEQEKEERGVEREQQSEVEEMKPEADGDSDSGSQVSEEQNSPFLQGNGTLYSKLPPNQLHLPPESTTLFEHPSQIV